MTDKVDELFLEHFGVKGQKWGVRKDKIVGQDGGRDYTKGDLKWKKKLATTKSYIDLNNSMANDMNAALPAFNKKYSEGKNLGYNSSTGQYNSPAGKKYVKEYEALAGRTAQKKAREIFGDSPSGNWSTKAAFSFDRGLTVEVVPSKIKHGDIQTTDDGILVIFDVTVDSNGVINPMGILSQSDNTVYLEHFGVKGQKWGVRKDKGGKGSSRKSKTRKELAIDNSRRNIRKNRKQISDKDLEKYINRLQNEKKLKDLLDDDLAPGKTVTKRILGESGQKVARTVIAGGALLVVKVAINKALGGSAGTDIARGKIK